MVAGSAGTVWVTAAHGYGTLDVKIVAGSATTGGWVTVEIADLSNWNADPVQKHVGFGLYGTGLLGAGAYHTSNAKFQW